MPTAIATRPSSPAFSFALKAVAWGLGLFGFLRLPWIETHAVLPLTQVQGRLASAVGGAPVLPVDVTLACSGTDALAMCVGAILAYPARWRARLAGALIGTGLILALNTVRIGTLGRVSGSPALFETLHLYVWPAALALAAAAYVFLWMRRADSGRSVVQSPFATTGVDAPAPGAAPNRPPSPHITAATRRFLVLAAALIVIFAAGSPLYLENAWVLAVAGFIARGAAAALRVIGVAALASGNLLVTARGAFVVTEECISTPLIPLYIAAVVAYAGTWPRRLVALVALVPIFVALGIARLLVVALPSALIASPLFFIHAFYQLLTAAVVVAAIAFWRHGAAAGGRRALAAIAIGAASLYLIAPVVSRVLAGGPAFPDAQGAVAFVPAFQIALFVALWTALCAPSAWRPLAAGVAVLALSHAALFAALHAAGGFAALATRVPEIRAWSLALPLTLAAAMRMHDRPRR